jgi:hypothetical protein
LTVRHPVREQFAKRITNAKDLWDLHEALVGFENDVAGDLRGTRHEIDADFELAAYGISLHELPTFGGTEPSAAARLNPQSTADVWSWEPSVC